MKKDSRSPKLYSVVDETHMLRALWVFHPWKEQMKWRSCFNNRQSLMIHIIGFVLKTFDIRCASHVKKKLFVIKITKELKKLLRKFWGETISSILISNCTKSQFWKSLRIVRPWLQSELMALIISSHSITHYRSKLILKSIMINRLRNFELLFLCFYCPTFDNNEKICSQ